MWKPDEFFFIKSHIAGSVATLASCLIIIVICLIPSCSPGIYKLLVDERITIVVPYLLFLSLAGSLFSIWFFLFRNKKN
jgi:hypothetical protein